MISSVDISEEELDSPSRVCFYLFIYLYLFESKLTYLIKKVSKEEIIDGFLFFFFFFFFFF